MNKTPKRVLAAAVAVLAVALSAVIAGSARADDRDSTWQTLADKIYANASSNYDTVTSRGENVQAFHVAAIAWYAGQRSGWKDDRTQTWLKRVYDRATPTGGYGTGIAHDYFGDGTVNPADTTYSITTSWHVGRMLIDGYKGGGVPASRVVAAVKSLLDTPQSPKRDCVAYSTSRNDSTYPCVWNVGAASAWFLWRAYQNGLYPDGTGDALLSKVRTWRNHVREDYSTSLGGWNYIENGPNKLDDPGHLGATVSAMYEADPSIGTTALAAYWRHYTGSTSAVDLVPYDCSKAAATYTPVKNYALSNLGSPEKNMGLAAFAPVVLRAATTCKV
ncbi:MAG TPA: hypothetical protein VE172_04625 [Stackebrandtia sp.]|uniref:hypothetical protein n=1 Tax=Stackebrandtia sp. TaxID=2023065 RepID=UPI002D5784AB|nr:hypothetical protein [Stackebrandtia sp.]HZE38078.1 hypothetical protein [Stackebrandtia sp.]